LEISNEDLRRKADITSESSVVHISKKGSAKIALNKSDQKSQLLKKSESLKKNQKSELFRNFRSTDLISGFFSEVQKFSELQIFCQVADAA